MKDKQTSGRTVNGDDNCPVGGKYSCPAGGDDRRPSEGRYLRHLVLTLYVGFIFANSLTPASLSSQESGAVLRFVLQCLGAAGIPSAWLTEHIIRKCAHFTEYTVLGILLCGSTRRLSGDRKFKVLVHLCFLFFIPFVDETLQLFTEGRAGQISDVWLDMSGVLFGTLLSMTVRRLFYGLRRGRDSAE